MVHILNFDFINYNETKKWQLQCIIDQCIPKYHHKFILRDDKTGIEIFEDLEIHTLELKKFVVNATDIEGIKINIKNL